MRPAPIVPRLFHNTHLERGAFAGCIFVPGVVFSRIPVTVKVKWLEVLVGYIIKLGQDRDAKFLFNLKGVGGLSMPGWYAQAHIIASVTGEKYEEINPGTVITETPIKKKN